MKKDANFWLKYQNGHMYYVFNTSHACWDYYEKICKEVVCRVCCFGEYENAIEFL